MVLALHLLLNLALYLFQAPVLPVQATIDSLDPLCALPSSDYVSAQLNHPEIAFALSTLEQYAPVATWLTCATNNVDTATELISMCWETSVLSVVVQGLTLDAQPACEANESSQDYQVFLNGWSGILSDRNVVYVLEPHTMEHLVVASEENSECSMQANLLTGVQILSATPNAQIYVEVTSSLLENQESILKVAMIMTELAAVSAQVKGIALNVGDSRPTQEVAVLCNTFQATVGIDKGLKCVIDTSQNYYSACNKECDPATAGIGLVPNGETGYDSIDYFIWTTAPGVVNSGEFGSNKIDIMVDSDDFSVEMFTQLWNQGVFVQEQNMTRIDDGATSGSSTAAPTPTATISAASLDGQWGELFENITQTFVEQQRASTTGFNASTSSDEPLPVPSSSSIAPAPMVAPSSGSDGSAVEISTQTHDDLNIKLSVLGVLACAGIGMVLLIIYLYQTRFKYGDHASPVHTSTMRISPH